MSRYTAAKCKLCRRERKKLFLKGDKCYTAKCAVQRRAYAPGQHGDITPKVSEYGIRLREKQTARKIYGISERQFSEYFDKASKSKGITGERLLELLERRLDNVVFRLGMAASRYQARQLVRHRHIMVSGRRVNIPSFQVKVGNSIMPVEGTKSLVKTRIEKSQERTVPEWLSFDEDKLEGKVLSIPRRDQVEAEIQENLIVEFYSL